MGSYSTLLIGQVELSWGSYVPTFLTFLFTENDFYTIPDEPNGEEWFDEIGFRSTCGDVLATMDRYGYTVDFFSEVYDVFHEQLTEKLSSILAEEFAQKGMSDEDVSRTVNARLQSVAGYSRSDELREYVAFLRRAITSDFTGPEFEHEVMIGFGSNITAVPGAEYIRTYGRGVSYTQKFGALHEYILKQASKLSPAVVRLTMLFDEDFVDEYTEASALMDTRLLLEATPRDSAVVLDLREISLASGLETAEDVKEAHAKLPRILANKIDLYNRVFKVLSTNERDVREMSARSRGRSLQLDVQRAAGSDEKGRALEELMAVIFEADPGLQVIERRFTTGDEEIDLVLKNNVDQPFWTSLNSPLIFVECKNWSQAVGSAEARDFEMKLQNHRPLAKVGVFVAYGGVTSEFITEIKRASRAEYLLTIVERDDIARFLAGSKGVVEWLEEKIARPL